MEDENHHMRDMGVPTSTTTTFYNERPGGRLNQYLAYNPTLGNKENCTVQPLKIITLTQ
jgi:hypothetical protein